MSLEYNAVITNEERNKGEKRWKWIYTFIDVDTGKEDYFYSRKKVNHTPNIIGELKLIQDDKGSKFYQDFDQDEFKPFKSPKQIEKEIKENVQKLVDNLSKKRMDFEKSQFLGILDALHQADGTWDKVADKRFRRTSRTLRYWRKDLVNPTLRILKKRGRKRKMCEDCFLLLLFLTNSPKYNAKTQQWKSDEIFKRTSHRYSRQVLSYNLKKYSDFTRKRAAKRYSEQDLEEIWNFLREYSWVYSHPNCLAVDEFGTHPGEAPRFASSRRGCPAIVEQKGKRGSNYTLILCVRNVEKGAVISSKMIKNVKSKERKTKGTTAVDFYNFLKNLELPTNETYYLLLDNSSIHYTTEELEDLGLSIEELARQKNIVLVYLPRYTPEINPIELCFNTTRYLTENKPTDTDEELEQSFDEIIDEINQKPLTKYFRHCQDFFSFDQSGN